MSLVDNFEPFGSCCSEILFLGHSCWICSREDASILKFSGVMAKAVVCSTASVIKGFCPCFSQAYRKEH